MKKIILIICLVLLFPGAAFAMEPSQSVMEEQQKSVDIDELNNALDKMVSPESSEIVQFNLKDTIQNLITGKASFNMKEIFGKVVKYFFKEVYANLSVIIKVIVLVLVCALLTNLQSSFGKEGVGQVAFYSCYILIAMVLIKNFMIMLDMGKQVVENMVLFMQAFVPTIFLLLISTGSITTASVLEPSIIFSIEVIATLIKSIIMPLILFYTVLAIINNISDKVQVSKLASFIKNAGMWMIGIFLTIFIAVITMQSTVTSAADGIGTRTAKFAVSAFIPVVGKLLSDAVETVVGYSMLLKNSISVVGMIIIVLICLVPIIKVFAMVVVYKLTAALVQPISDERVVKCLSEMSDSLVLVGGIILSVAVMFIISVAIMMNAGNAAAMMR